MFSYRTSPFFELVNSFQATGPGEVEMASDASASIIPDFAPGRARSGDPGSSGGVASGGTPGRSGRARVSGSTGATGAGATGATVATVVSVSGCALARPRNVKKPWIREFPQTKREHL